MLGFNALSSSPISDILSAEVSTRADISCSAVVSATILVSKNNSAAIDATAVVSGSVNITNNLLAAESATATISGAIDLTKDLSTAIDATAVTAGAIVVDRPLSVAIDATAVTSGAIVVDRPLSATIDATAVVSGSIVIDNPIVSAIIGTATISGAIDLTKDLSASESATGVASGSIVIDNLLATVIDATAVTAGAIVVDRPLSAAIDAAAVTSGSVLVDRPLATTIDATATVSASFTLDNQLQASETATASATATIGVDINFTGAIDATATTEAVISISNNLSSVCFAEATADATVSLLNNLAADISADALAEASLATSTSLQSLIDATAEVTANLTAEVSLAANINVTAEAVIQEETPQISLVGELLAAVSCYPLLDVDGNTDGSDGGGPVDGFFPPNSVILGSHPESAPTAVYSITSNFNQTDPLVTTEITKIVVVNNPSNVISSAIAGNQALITANTPKIIYAQNSTFTTERVMVPFENQARDYDLSFNSKLNPISTGKSFYSDSFYSERNLLCFLMDDGTGTVNLVQQVTPIQTKILKSVGKVNYANGNVYLDDLFVKEKVKQDLKFYANSYDAVIPTKEYFNEKNSQLIQSRTLAFPGGEKVEIYKYEKNPNTIDVEILVTARSHVAGTTVEERTAKYKLRILPDYDIGKNALKQLIEEQTL